jgi:SAM-dependent methyltransferase
MDWEQARVDALVADIFGFNAVQLGLPQFDLLRENRIPLKFRAGSAAGLDVRCDLQHLPFASSSLDLVILPHVLEFYPEPHQVLREVERVLVPEGHAVICGFNPYSLWGIRNQFSRREQGFPWCGQYLSVLRLKDWLALLSLEPRSGHFGCYAPPVQEQRWINRWRLMELAGNRWWPIAGATYILHAVKRVHGMRLVKPGWKERTSRARALAPAMQNQDHDRNAVRR